VKKKEKGKEEKKKKLKPINKDQKKKNTSLC
jgi:hypothetical protein